MRPRAVSRFARLPIQTTLDNYSFTQQQDHDYRLRYFDAIPDLSVFVGHSAEDLDAIAHFPRCYNLSLSICQRS